MARKARQRISYVLPLANSATGHRLGVNGLAVDSDHSLLYSGGRDGVICSWDLNYDIQDSTPPDLDAKSPDHPQTLFHQKVQAHTHWINDIALVQSNQALVSASSDITVKLWRPSAKDGMPPQTVGLHSDYIKTLASPSPTSDWIASGGLDRKINVWDLNGAGQKLSIDVGGDEGSSLLSKEKGSVYALAATDTTLTSGGPESTVKVWDTRSGQRVTKLVGHTDNIRDILVSYDGTTILTASSDRTVKVWSTTAGRCMFTLTMHDASVWSLYSSHPDLTVFYSSDRNGLVAKTDTRNTAEMDDGISVAICQEHEGVHKVTAAGDSVWTATSRPSINRWLDVNTENAEIEFPENFNPHRSSIITQKSRYPSPPSHRESLQSFSKRASITPKRKIPLKHMLRLSNTAFFPVPVRDNDRDPPGTRRGTLDGTTAESGRLQPARAVPDYSIEGQNGIKRGVMMNDRRRALTLDTAGEVVMWDLLRCVPIRSYGRRDLDEVKEKETTTAMVGNWCAIHTKTGSLSVVLEENTCFDAEVYVDELNLEPPKDAEFREDQRVNLGKWVLRYLFANLIAEEERRDEAFRSRLLNPQEREKLKRENAPTSIELPPPQTNGWYPDVSSSHSTSTLRPNTNGVSKGATTPGLNISLATPAFVANATTKAAAPGTLSPTAEENASGQEDSQRGSTDRESDYFSSSRAPNTELSTPGGGSQAPVTPQEHQEPQTEPEPGVKENATPGKEGFFGKKLRMGMSFSGMKKIGRTQTNDKQPAVEEKELQESDSQSSKGSNVRVVDDNLLGVVQKMRFAYEDSVQQQIASQQARENGLPVAAITELQLPTTITPSPETETPLLTTPPNTTILIQEDRPEAGGVADLFEGTVGALGELCDSVEKVAPMWLGDILLRNQIPVKDVVKISFVLEPYQAELPSIASDGNNRLNANRMLRAKKILGYVAERIEPGPPPEQKEGQLRPEEYLELWCQNQVVPPTMTLATIRSHLWRGGGDILLYYRANGRKPIPFSGTSGYPPKPSTRDEQDTRPGAAV